MPNGQGTFQVKRQEINNQKAYQVLSELQTSNNTTQNSSFHGDSML